VVTRLDADYLVVGAGAAGMAFTDALIDHADATVVLVDRRHGVGGHWLQAYPFVRLHQASVFYGVASTPLGEGRVQRDGPEAGLHERASAPEICAYYTGVLQRMSRSSRVSFYSQCDYAGDGRFVSRVSGKAYDVRVSRRVVDARYLSPQVPADTPAPFEVADGATVIAVNDLVDLAESPSQFVVVGSGKTATDACIWLLDNEVDPGRICWVRPRDPWMLNRAVVQPDPAVFLGMVADTLEAAADASSPDDLFLRLEDAGVMLRIDPAVIPTMAKTPTLAQWELDRLRSIEDVVRLGYLHRVEPGRLVFAHAQVSVAPDAVVVHAAAPGLPRRPTVPIWRREAITLQPIRAGFPCFGAALAGFVEATVDGDESKNRLCPPTPYADTPSDWAAMQVLGARATASFTADPAIKAWADTVALNPARVPAGTPRSAQLTDAVERLNRYRPSGMARMTELAGIR